MKLDNKTNKIAIFVIILISISISTIYMFVKLGYHEDEILTFNLANSSKELKVDGEWNTDKDFKEYLITGGNRFNYANVYEKQVEGAAHPPLYYGIVHTICSLFPNTFSRWCAYIVNIFMMSGAIILIYKNKY